MTLHRTLIERRSRFGWRAECGCGWKSAPLLHPLLAEREAERHLLKQDDTLNESKIVSGKSTPCRTHCPCYFDPERSGKCCICEEVRTPLVVRESDFDNALKARTLANMRPASAAHLALTAAVLQCIEAEIEPDTIRRFVNEELPPTAGAA